MSASSPSPGEVGLVVLLSAGAIPVTFSDFGIPNPGAGSAKVGDEGSLEFLLVLGR